MKQSFNKNYPYQLWLFSALLGSIYLLAFFLIWYTSQIGFKDSIGLFLISMLFSTLFSWLVFLICYFSFWRLIAKETPLGKIKVILCLIGIAGMLLTAAFFGLDLFSFDEDLLIPFAYLLGIVTATGYVKIRTTN